MNFFQRISYGLFWFAMMFAAGFVAWWGIVNQPDLIPLDRMIKTPEDDIGSITARDTIVKEVSEDGLVRWSLEGSDLIGRISGDISLKNPKATIHVGDNTSILLIAPDGRYNSSDSETILLGGVTAQYENDDSTFWAQEIRFSDLDKSIKSLNGPVKMKRGNWEFHADGILIDLSQTNITINLSKPVEMYQFE